MDLEQILRLPVDELKLQARMGVRLLPDVAAMIQDFATQMADELAANNRRGEPTRWILPVGPVAQYWPLVERCNREGISWRDAVIFQMDDFLDWQCRPLAATDPLNFEIFMRRNVYEKLRPELRPREENLHFPDPFAPDRISEAIRAAGGVDTCFGGIGYHGHIAFNEPPISRWYKVTAEEMRNSLTRIVPVGDDSTVVLSIHCTGGSCESIPPMGITLGLKDIRASRKLRFFLAGGARHSAVFRIALLADPCVEYPATLVQDHPDCVVHTDVVTAQPVHPSLAWGLPTS